MVDYNETRQIEADILRLIQEQSDTYYLSLKDISNWLFIQNDYQEYYSNEQYRIEFYRKLTQEGSIHLEEDDPESTDTQDFIMINNNDIEYPWFSDHGFKTFCLMHSTLSSKIVLKCFIRAEERYMYNLKKTIRDTENKITELVNDINYIKQENISEVTRLKNTINFNVQRSSDLERTVDRLEMKIRIITMQRDKAAAEALHNVTHLKQMVMEQCITQNISSERNSDEVCELYNLRLAELNIN
jgi:hypothetical protein